MPGLGDLERLRAAADRLAQILHHRLAEHGIAQADRHEALAAPLANVDKITIVSTGNGDASGMNKITGDITKMAAQVPALFETLSGMPLGELLGKVRQIGEKSEKPAQK